MLILYQSNRLEQLGQLFAGMVSNVPLSSPFAKETVIVQSRGMGRWLTLDVARALGIAANMDFVLPAAFAWKLMQKVLPGLPAKSGFSPDVLTWRLFDLLPTLQEELFAPLQRYIQTGERACFELAGKVADIYDQYLVFRPDWIRAWEQGQLLDLGDDEPWQAALWRIVAAQDPGRHRVRMLDEFFSQLKPEHLPERITLFGIASLAPMYLALVKRLSELTNVCLFTLNPCEAYWGDIVDARRKLKLREKGDLFATEGHPLLASLGKQGRDFFELIVSDAELDAKPLFADVEGKSLLSCLQRDILELNTPGEPLYYWQPSDQSVQVHAVHGPMRELEVLKDSLLAMFDQDASLTPADIVVLTPDINTYAPYIDAVFSYRDDAPNLPYTIADRRQEKEDPLLSTFMAVLQLVDSRFQADEVLALLDSPALLERFGLSEEDLPFIQQWVRDSGIRWGRDAAHKAELGLAAEANFTWRWGLDRLLLGSVLPMQMAGQASPLWQGLLPATLVEGQWAECLARFASFFNVLETLARLWQQPAAVAEWVERLQHALDVLFAAGNDEQHALDVIRETLAQLGEDSTLAASESAVSLPVVRDWLIRRLTVSSSSGFLSGAVTFCAMVPMRSIPFRVLCLIGMNDGAYPRDERPVSFDLVARHPRRGDRSRRFDDRYLFLEAILSARERLYLSYVGLSARTNEHLPASPLVAELLDTFTQMCGQDMAKALTLKHPLQPFSPACYDAKQPALQSYEPVFVSALQQEGSEPVPFASALPDKSVPAVISVQEFIRFWQHPVRAWLRSRLAIGLSSHDVEQAVREPFALDRNARQDIRHTLVRGLLHRQPLPRLQERLHGEGVLPSAELGDAWLADESSASLRFVHRLPADVRNPALPPQPVHLEWEGVTLAGELTELRPQGYFKVVPRPVNAAERIDWWLTHLLLCASRPHGVQCESTLFDETGHYTLQDEPDAIRLLAPWVHYWQQGQQQPLPFFGRTSWAYAQALQQEPQLGEKALKKAMDKWDPAFLADGSVAQKDEPPIALAFRHQDPLAMPLFTELACELLIPLAGRLAQAEGGE